MMRVRDIMHPRVVRIGPDASLAELIRLLARKGISGVPVVEPDCKLAGVVSVTNLLAAIAEELENRQSPAVPNDGTVANTVADVAAFKPMLSEAAFMNRKVKEIMTPVAFSVPPETPVSELAQALRDEGMHRALVVDRGRLCGIVTAFDVLLAATS